jgi:hypothetical protein
MRPDWILSPLAQYGMAAAGLIAGLFQFLALKVELSALKRSGETARDELTGRLKETEAALANLRETAAETAAEAGERNTPQGPALNLTRRTQALRMYRRGETVETIAGALRTPRNEIQLLIKLQELNERPSLSEGSSA